MKINDLLVEDYTTKNYRKELGFNKDRKFPYGDASTWLEAMGLTSETVKEALAQVRKLPEYKAILATGMKDVSTSRHTKNGTISFTRPGYNKGDGSYSVLGNGKLDARHGQYGHPNSSGKPKIVAGNPVASMVASMKEALKKLLPIIIKSQKQEDNAKALGERK